jgi:hypothetical protein
LPFKKIHPILQYVLQGIDHTSNSEISVELYIIKLYSSVIILKYSHNQSQVGFFYFSIYRFNILVVIFSKNLAKLVEFTKKNPKFTKILPIF